MGLDKVLGAKYEFAICWNRAGIGLLLGVALGYTR